MSRLEDLFADAEQDPRMDPEQWRLKSPDLRTALIREQHARRERADRALLIVVAGLDGVGKGASINLLNAWMDPRYLRTRAFDPDDLPSERFKGLEALALQPYWDSLPPRGRSLVVFNSWYQPLFRALRQKQAPLDLIERQAAHIRRFESLLLEEGVDVLKLWFHLSKTAHAQRTQQLLSDPATAWQVTKADQKVDRHFKRWRRSALMLLEMSDHTSSPWYVVPSADPHMRDLTIGQHVLEFLQRTGPSSRQIITASDPVVARPANGKTELTVSVTGGPDARSNSEIPDRLDTLDLTASLQRSDYERLLAESTRDVALQLRGPKFSKRRLIIVFEGQDAAGKGGAIRRVMRAIDVRQAEIHPIAAPTDEELARPYLWRFWRRIPPPGKVGIFDRSWYGRVLVERVEGFAQPADWQRAYGEINDFEAQLVESGTVVVKFWLAISDDEQLKRFQARGNSPYKSFKLGSEDWRNRQRWNDYLQAANEMLHKTDTPAAPWTVVAANCKRHARVTIMQKIADQLAKALDER